jgi:phenylalanyl-tRNA synthetase alpha chain
MSDDQTRTADTLERLQSAATLADLEAIRVEALGKQGWVSALMKTLGSMSPDERQVEGPRIQGIRTAVTDAVAARKAVLEAAALEQQLASERLDLTLPASATPRGTVHPVSQVMDELAEIFAISASRSATGPEIEDDWHNFTALNMAETHPARAMHDTFYFPDTDTEGRRMLLRTHTSPVQIRSMMQQGAPIRIIAPGRVYRSDSDATHTPMFHQVEGLVIDRGIHLGHLKWTLETFLKAFFERDDIVLRLRPSYFPFTEPSVEVDVGYSRQDGRRVVGGSGDDKGHEWMELLGSGMVNRRVLEFAGVDPDQYQGFAFGVGVDRLAMLKYGMDDLRAFFDGDERWLGALRLLRFRPADSIRRCGSKAVKFSLEWLRDFLDTDATVQEIAAMLNRIGHEVEGVEDPADKLRGFRIARVLTAEKHPQADKLQVLTVDAGDGKPLQVVCGAPNARAGMLGVLGLPGAVVPANGMELKKSAIRGVESNGMMCSVRELELGDEHDGIIELPGDAPIGKSFSDYQASSPVFDVAITPNRPDCMGVHGIARDLSAAGTGRVQSPNGAEDRSLQSLSAEIRTDDPEGCPPFTPALFAASATVPVPEWMQRRCSRAVSGRSTRWWTRPTT